MINESEKHRAITVQVVGFALMSPFGNLIMNIFGFDILKFGIVFFLSYVLISLVLFYFGIICLIRSCEISKGSNRY